MPLEVELQEYWYRGAKRQLSNGQCPGLLHQYALFLQELKPLNEHPIEAMIRCPLVTIFPRAEDDELSPC